MSRQKESFRKKSRKWCMMEGEDMGERGDLYVFKETDVPF